jgi:hypothetical protein
VGAQTGDTASQLVEAALATAWGGAGPAPLRPPPPSLFVASGRKGKGRVDSSQSEKERPFGFVRDELARFSLENIGIGSSGSSTRGAGSNVRTSKDSAQDLKQRSRLQLRSSNSSSSSHHSSDSEDSLQADASATVIHRGLRSDAGSRGSDNDAVLVAEAPADSSDSEVRAAAAPSPFSSWVHPVDFLTPVEHDSYLTFLPLLTYLSCRSTASIVLLSNITSAITDAIVCVSPTDVKASFSRFVKCWHMTARRRYNFVHGNEKECIGCI